MLTVVSDCSLLQQSSIRFGGGGGGGGGGGRGGGGGGGGGEGVEGDKGRQRREIETAQCNVRKFRSINSSKPSLE